MSSAWVRIGPNHPHFFIHQSHLAPSIPLFPPSSGPGQLARGAGVHAGVCRAAGEGAEGSQGPQTGRGQPGSVSDCTAPTLSPVATYSSL